MPAPAARISTSSAAAMSFPLVQNRRGPSSSPKRRTRSASGFVTDSFMSGSRDCAQPASAALCSAGRGRCRVLPFYCHGKSLTPVNLWGLEGKQGNTMARKDPPVHKPERNPLRGTGLHTPKASDSPGRPKKKRLSSKVRIALIIAAVWLLFGGGIVFSHWLSDLPDTRNLLAYEPGNDISVLDAKGRMIARRGLTSGEKVAMGELPAYVGNAFIAVEDRRFRYHFGIDPMGLMRAAYADLTQGAFVQGGSTLTQQLAKNLFLKPDRTFSRKMEEAILAVYLETRYSKDEILTLYLNRVYFGAGVYGLGAASERFFGKPARELTLTEAAILAGSVKAPSRYNPEASPDAALSRAALVLGAMEESGFIDHRARLAAASTRPKIAHSFATPGAGYFVDYIVSQVSGFVGKSKERLIVDTTL